MRTARRWCRPTSSAKRSRAASRRPAAWRALTSTATRASASRALTGGWGVAPDMGYGPGTDLFTVIVKDVQNAVEANTGLEREGLQASTSSGLQASFVS